MKLKKVPFILITFVFCLSASLCFLIGRIVNNAVGDGIYIISMQREQMFFSRDNITFLTKEDYSFTFTENMYMHVSSEIANAEIKTVGTNENFLYMACLEIISGSFFNTMHIEKHSNVVVLNSEAANQLFGNVRGVGNVISIGDEPYEVIGIVKNDLNHNGALLYMPVAIMNQYVLDNLKITDIWLNLSDISEAELITAMLGYSADDVEILQLNQYKDIVMQRFRISIFIVGIIIIFYMCKVIIKSMNILRQILTEFLKENYFSKILLVFKKDKFLTTFLVLILNMSVGLTLFYIIRFKVYIPTYNILARNSGLYVLSNILDFYMQSYIGIPSLQYLNNLNMVSNILFFISLLTEVVLVLCLRRKTC